MSRRELSVYVAVAAAAVVLCLVVTRHSVAFNTDSGVYLATAQNVLDGHGVTTPFPPFTSEYGPSEAASFRGAIPLTHYPPLYPLSIAAVAATGTDVLLAARVLGAVLIGVNLVLLSLLARLVLPGRLATVCVLVLALVGPVSGLDLGPDHSWLFVHGLAMSEALFIAFSVATLLVLERHLATGSTRLLVVAGALAGLATATRFVGVALIVTGAVLVLPRLRHAAAFASVSVLPITIWTLVARLFLDGGAPRSFHLSNPRLSEIFVVFEGWLGLAGLPSILGHVALAVVIAFLVGVVTRNRSPLLRVLGAYVLAYAAAVVLTRALFDLSTPFNDRVFSPLQGVFYVLLFGALATRRAPAMRLLVVAGPVMLVLIGMPAAWRLLDHGNPAAPHPEDTFAATSELPTDALIATNIPTRLWEVSRRPSINVPVRTIAVSDKVNRQFDAQVRELVDVIAERHGYIVLLGPPKAGFASLLFATEQDFVQFGSLRVVRRTGDGVILGAH